MATTDQIPELDLARVHQFCHEQTPEHLRDQMRLEVDVRGRSITIVERRPLWNDPSAEWTRMKVAQLRYDDSGPSWTLYWRDSRERWHRYDDLDPSETISALLDEINEDPTGIFFG